MEITEKDLEVQELETTLEPDLYHRPARLKRIAQYAGILAWVIIAASVIYGIVMYIYYGKQIAGVASQYSILEVLPAFITPLTYILPGLFLSVVLFFISEGIFMMMDIEENTRKS
jgi:hypothetical protein